MAGPVDSKSGKRSRILKIADNMIGSSKNLWVLISGAGAITSKELVGNELQKNLQRLTSGLNFYLTPSSSSAKKLQSDIKVDAKVHSFILQLAKFMNLDEIQCYELFCDFLLYDYRGSETSLQNAVSNERFTQNLMLQIWDYYCCERLYLLMCINEILAHFDDNQHPYHDLFDEFLSLIDQGNALRTSLLNQWETLIKVVIPKNKHPSYLIDAQSKTLLWFTLREQCELLHAMLIYFNGKPGDAGIFLSLLKSFKEHGFGWQQLHTYRANINSASQGILQSIGYLECLILLRALNLHTLNDVADGNRGFFLYKSKSIWQEVDAIMCRLAVQREPVGKLISLLCLAWAVVRFYVLGDGDSPNHGITRNLGESALQFGAFDFLHSMMLNRTFHGDGPIPRVARSIIYWLLVALLSKFDESTLGDTQSLYWVVGELSKDPNVSEMIWEQGLDSSLGMLLTTAMSYFPHCFCTLVDLLSGLAESSPVSASKVFAFFSTLTSFTSALMPDMDVEELRTDEQMLRLAKDFKTDTMLIEAGIIGYSVPSMIQSQYDVVQWQKDVNGWEICLSMMKAIVGFEQVTSNQIRNVASLARLLRCVLVMEPDTYMELDQLVDQLFLVIQRFAKLTNPPADVIASALHLASAVSGNARLLRMWQRLVQVGFLPMNPTIASSYHNNVEFSHGTINSIISSYECVTGEYPVTLAFLNLISTFVPVLIDQDDIHFSACVAFIVREIFPAHSRFWYRSAEQKEEMAQKCLKVIHLILRVPSSNAKPNAGTIYKSSLQSVVLQCLLHQEAGHSLLKIICQLAIKPSRSDASDGSGAEDEAIHLALEQQIGWVSGHGLQPFKFALSVLNRLLILWSCETPHQPSALISSLCSNPHAIRTVANYIYQSDTRLATLAVLLMRRFAKELPISLLVCLGPDAPTFCKLLLFRLEARAEDIHLKAAILTFMSACVESQPGTTEVFIGDLNNEKPSSKEKQLPGSCRSHCLNLVVSILRRAKEESSDRLEELRVGALSFLKSLWIGRQAIALNDLRKCSDIWNILLEPLLEDDGLTSHAQSSALTLGILAQEFILKPSRRENGAQLLDLLQKISDPVLLKWMGSVYEKCSVQGSNMLAETSLMADNIAGSTDGLLKSWNDFLSIGLKTNLLTVPTTQKSIIVNVTINALNDELSRDGKKMHIKVLSETLLHLLRLWHGSELNSSEVMEAIVRLLNSAMAAGTNIPSKILSNIVASVIQIVPDSSEDAPDPETTNSWMGIICDVIHQSVLLAEKAIEHSGPSAPIKTQLVVLCVSLLEKFSWVCGDAKLLLVHLQRSAVLHTLLRFTLTCLRCRVLDGCHDVLQLFCNLSNHPEVACSILEAEVVQALCLPLAELGLFTTAVCADKTLQQRWWNVYRSALHLFTCLLHNLRHYIMEPVFLDFVKVHLASLMTIPGQLQSNLCSETLDMALSILHLIKELSHFRSLQMHGISPRQEIVAITSNICYISIAYILRPRLILHSMGIWVPEVDKEKSTPRKLSLADYDHKNPKQTEAIAKLIQLASLGTSVLCSFSPDLLELLSSKGYDTEHWEQLLAFGFTTPSLDQITEANFGTVISSVIVCLKLLGLGDQTSSPLSTSSSPEIAFPDRKLVTMFLERSLYLILSQAILLNARQPVWDKQLFKRELGAELGQFVHSRHLRRVPGGSSPLCSPASSAPAISPVQTRLRAPFEKSPFLTLVSTLVENLFK